MRSIASLPALVFSLLVTQNIVVADPVRHFVDAKPKGGIDWKPQETRTLETMTLAVSAPVPETRFGGRADRLQKATGFFRVEKIGDRWWLIDPDGGLFVFNGVASVKPRDDFAAKVPFEKLFGSTDAWRTKTLDQFRALGFRGCGGFSDHETLRAASKPMPYTVTLSLMSSFGKTLGLTHQQPGHTGYEGDCLPVFHPDFAAHCASICRDKLSAMKDDAFLVGVFSDNEMPIPADMLDRMLKLDATRNRFNAMHDGAVAWLAQRGIARDKITDADRRAFLERVYDLYFEITTKAIRTVLPHHLCLGSRFHDPAVSKQGVWRAAGKWCDAISINYYYVWTPRAVDLRHWVEWSGKPCLITEFYAKGADSGMANTTGAGWLVRTQAERGAFYQNFALALMESKTCVGWH